MFEVIFWYIAFVYVLHCLGAWYVAYAVGELSEFIGVASHRHFIVFWVFDEVAVFQGVTCLVFYDC